MIEYFQHFGAKVSAEDLKNFAQSPNWDGKIFKNTSKTSIAIGAKELPSLLYKQFFDKAGRKPSSPIIIKPFDKEAFLDSTDEPKAVWFGHSVILLRINGLTILCDPMFGPDTAPIAPFPSKRYSDNTLALIDDLPPIDLVLLTHDHYDHLDLQSIKKIHPNVEHFYVALGTARHLKKWGVNPAKITEFDWWQSHNFKDLAITFTPTRHFSGRGLSDRAKSLWGGWAIKSGTHSIYISGDSGIDEHFKEVGERLGPFDFGFVECGQYNPLWHAIHMFPEESVQVAQLVELKRAMPIHWGAFTLSLHSWTEPVERFIKAAEAVNQAYITPEIGSLFSLKTPTKTTNWWEKYQ